MAVRFDTPRLSIAPMMARTDRHFRYFVRQLTRRALLYSEMVTTGALIHGDRARHLDFSAAERPVALQLGGDDPRALAACARIGVEWGYDEINLNVGCPSDRVQNGNFGACLMARPETVADAVAAMLDAVDVPVTVKHRIGIDELDRYEDMARFVATVAAAGCRRFTVHARKAWLQGLSPKENRTIPPLRYADVYRLKEDFPHLAIEINGGVRSLRAAREHLERVDAVMVGRAAFEDPWVLAQADQLIFGEPPRPITRHDVVEAVIPYAARLVAAGHRIHHISRHLLPLFNGRPGARRWRRALSEGAARGAGAELLAEALQRVPRESPESVHASVAPALSVRSH